MLINLIRLGVYWCIAKHLTQNVKERVVLNVYTPYEYHNNENDYFNRLAFINSLIQRNDFSCACVVGDMNTDMTGTRSVFANDMNNFCQDNNLILSSRQRLPKDSYTYISDAWDTTSC